MTHNIADSYLRWDSSEITFDAEKHVYRLHGEEILSPNRIMSLAGISSIPKGIPAIEKRKELGTFVHQATAIDDGQFPGTVLDINDVDDQLKPHVIANQRFRDEFRFKQGHIEKILYNPEANICGTTDRFGFIEIDDPKMLSEIIMPHFGKILKSYPIVIDIKTSKNYYRSHIYALSFYASCYHGDLSDAAVYPLRGILCLNEFEKFHLWIVRDYPIADDLRQLRAFRDTALTVLESKKNKGIIGTPNMDIAVSW